jgi:hypothetical protein
MGRSSNPPSLTVTPELIEQYLFRFDVKCHACGYSLRGLPKPMCPECGRWTELAEPIRRLLLGRVKHRLAGWGVVDRHLVQIGNRRTLRILAWDDIDRFDIRRRWSPRAQRILLMLSIGLSAAILESFALMIWRQDAMQIIPVAVTCPLALICWFLLGGRSVQNWLIVRMNDGHAWTIPVPNRDYEHIEKRLTFWDEFMARPPERVEAMRDLQREAAAEHVRERRCPRCGYSLDGPRLRVKRERMTGWGVALITLGIIGPLTGICCCTGGDIGYLSGEEMLGGLISGVFGLALIIGGIALMFSRGEKLAVPDWPGKGACSACGWRPSKPPVRGESER